MRAAPDTTIAEEVERLRRMPVADLRVVWQRLLGVETRNRNRDFLWRRLAHHLQERAEGGLSARARARLEELMRQEPIRVPRPLPPVPMPVGHVRDPRLPDAGTVLRREFGSEIHEIEVLVDGFTYRGERFPSLSAVARHITGTRWNGYRFFGIARTEGAA
jgi:hypothetical protein